MAATRAASKPADPGASKPEGDQPTPAPSGDEAKPVTHAELEGAVEGAVHKAIDTALAPFRALLEEPPEGEPAGESETKAPQGPRAEESRMEEIVSAKVKELLAKEPEKKAEAPAKHEPEQPPGKKGRWVERVVWG